MSAPPNGNVSDRCEASHADYEELRAHVPLPATASIEPADEAADVGSQPGSKISVMAWLVGVGQQVVRRFRGGTRVPPTPMARIHGR